MVTREEYYAWAKEFSSALGLIWEDQAKTLSLWYPVLERYGLDQLKTAQAQMLRATRRLDMQGVRIELLRILRDSEAIQTSARKIDDVRGVCDLCQGEGWVAVPHPKSILNGEWKPHRTAAGIYYAKATVTCTCRKGKWVQQGCENAVQEGKKFALRPMSLEKYECYVCPHWREEVAERKRIQGEENRLNRIDEAKKRDPLNFDFITLMQLYEDSHGNQYQPINFAKDFRSGQEIVQVKQITGAGSGHICPCTLDMFVMRFQPVKTPTEPMPEPVPVSEPVPEKRAGAYQRGNF